MALTQTERAILRQAGILKPGMTDKEALKRLCEKSESPEPAPSGPPCRECGERQAKEDKNGSTWCGYCGLEYYPEELTQEK